MIMAIAMVIAVGLVGLVGFLLVRGADRPEHVSPRWIDSHVRDRRDDV
jgi:hypothetical protein